MIRTGTIALSILTSAALTSTAQTVSDDQLAREGPPAPVVTGTGRSPAQPSVLLSDAPAGSDAAAAPTGQAMTPPARFPGDVRRVDGSGNNPTAPVWGSVGQSFRRLTGVAYGDGRDAPAGVGRPSARAISNAVATQDGERPSAVGVSDMLWQWGQFLDHDIDLTPVADPAEPFDIAVPVGDRWFDPAHAGGVTIPLDRSLYVHQGGVRQQLNLITAWIDASNVYGSDATRAAALRSNDGSGRLRTSAGNLLPFNDAGLANAPSSSPAFFLAGDFRANEQVGLTAMHTLFVREHNYWADEIRGGDRRLDGEQIYQRARAMVAAELQAITYREFLPALLGPGALPPYRGYRDDLNPNISNLFATVAYRFGHSMLSEQLQRIGRNGASIPAGPLSLADAFFNPAELQSNGIGPILRGMCAQRAQEIDGLLVDGVRNFLFGPPGSGGFDLGSLNIQRGRDHGIGSYNDVRRDLGLPPAREFADINPDPAVRGDLAAAYRSVADVDAWVGGLAERHVPGAQVGETFLAVLREQFRRLRDGDRFWYQGYLPADMVATVERQSLAAILERHAGVDVAAASPFFAPAPIGACCRATECLQLTADRCSAEGGSYRGDGSACGGSTCSGAGVCRDGNEPNDSVAGATAVACRDMVTMVAGGTCLEGGDVDHFRVRTAPGQLLSASVLVERRGSDLAPALRLLDEHGDEIASSRGAGRGLRDARLSHVATTTSYTLAVSAERGAGHYDLGVMCRDLDPPRSFRDAARSGFGEFITSLSAAGITAGCSDQDFCPDAVVTRGQMAVFVVRALGVAADTSSAPRFDDVPASHAFFGHVQAFAALGITDGCGQGRFCPDEVVSRAQMAVFLVRALGLAARPDLGPSFGDVSNRHTFYPWIESFAAQGITGGCGGGRFCPDAAVTRGQMAVFLVRALGLPVAAASASFAEGAAVR